MDKNRLLEVIESIQGLKIEIWSQDFEHAMSGHPEVSLKRVRKALKAPSRIIQSKSSLNICLFYSIEIKTNQAEHFFFCVVVAVNKPGKGKMITAYEADFIKTGIELYSKRGRK